MHLTLEDNSTSALRGKQINLHQNYPVECFSEHFHFSMNYAGSLTAGLAAERCTVYHTSFVKLNTFLSFALAEEDLYMTFQPPCQPPLQAIQWLLSSRGTQPFDGGCLVLSGTVGSNQFNTPHQLFVCVFEIVSPTLRTEKDLHTEIAAFFVNEPHDMHTGVCTLVRSPLG